MQFNFLKGYKTYIVAAVTAIFGVVDKHGAFNQLVPYVLTGAGLAALRAAVGKIETKIADIESHLPPSVQAVVAPVVTAVENEVNAAVDAADNVATAGSTPQA